jgi:DNA repair exonuclease SbcCD ATPase subunit
VELEAKSSRLEARSAELEARSTELEALPAQNHYERINLEQYKKMHDKMHTVELLNQALVTQQREGNDELKRVKKELVDASERLAHLQNDKEAMDTLNHVLRTKEIESNNELQDARKRLLDVSERLLPSLFANLLVIGLLQQCPAHLNLVLL